MSQCQSTFWTEEGLLLRCTAHMMGCRGRAFQYCAELIMGCFREEPKADKGRHLDDLGRNGHKKGQLCINTLYLSSHALYLAEQTVLLSYYIPFCLFPGWGTLFPVSKQGSGHSNHGVATGANEGLGASSCAGTEGCRAHVPGCQHLGTPKWVKPSARRQGETTWEHGAAAASPLLGCQIRHILLTRSTWNQINNEHTNWNMLETGNHVCF